MKKHFLVCLFAALSLGSVVTSCSDDDEIVNPLSDTVVYTAENGLNLTFNGESLLGKEVRYTPSTVEATKATLELKGVAFDVMQHLTKAGGLAFNTAGVLPGTDVLTLDLTLAIEGDKCSYTGEGETDFCTYTYNGTITKSSLNLDFTNVKLKEAGLAAKWNLVPKTKNEFGTDVLTTPLHLVWDSSVKIPVELFPGFSIPMPIDGMLSTALDNLLLVHENNIHYTAIEYLETLFKNITLYEDGNITAEIKDVVNGKTDFETSPKNVAFYVVDKMPTATENGQLRVLLNLEKIDLLTKEGAKSSRADGEFDIFGSLAMIDPMIQNGIPVTLIQKEEGKLTLVLDEKLLLPILKGVVVPLLSNEGLVNSLLEGMKANPDMAGMVPQATAVFKNLPAVIDGTTKIEIGLNFEK